MSEKSYQGCGAEFAFGSNSTRRNLVPDRSEVTSRSNWAKDSSTLRVRRSKEVVVLNCRVTKLPWPISGRNVRGLVLLFE